LESLRQHCFAAFLLRLTAALDQDVEHLPVWIDRPPEIEPFTPNGEKPLIQMPRVARSGMPAPEWIGEILAKLQTPWANGFRRDDDSPGEHQLFHIAITEAKAAIPLHRMADDLDWEAVMRVTHSRWCIHTTRMAHQPGVGHAPQ
jgi:hypothetical protein